MHAARTTLSWVLMVAMLLSLPGRAMGHFVCTRGMAEAGAACPLCHGHAPAEQTGPEVGNSCCKFVANQSAVNASLALAQAEGPTLVQSPPLLSVTGLGFLMGPDHALQTFALQPSVPRTPTAGFLSNFLRL